MGELHHFYVGLVLVVVGFVIVFKGPQTVGLVVGIAGLYLMGDDLIQHWVQRNFTWAYRSPVNRLWRWILRDR